MAGHESGVRSAECGPPREARAEDRRLREVRAFLGPRKWVLSHDLAGKRQQIWSYVGD
jgi:hypothetical protein